MTMWYTGSAWQPLSRTDPPNTYIVDGITYQSLTSAYNGCVANNSSGATCEIWDYNLPETLNSPPWTFDGSEVPVHLHLGPGVLTINGPLTVPRLSTISGSGRAGSAGAAPGFGTVIQMVGTANTFGGLLLTASSTSLGTCTGVSITGGGGTGTGASASLVSGGSGITYVVMKSFGYNYGTGSLPTASFTPSGCSSASLSASLVTTAVFIGDSANFQGATTGSRLENVTVDCNNVPAASGVEVQNAQEQSGPRNVNVVNWAVRGMFIHGNGSINSSIVDSEVDGCYSSAACLIAGSSVGVEIDNTAERVDKLTVNAVNTANFVPSSGACTMGNTVGLAGTFATSVFNVGGYILVAGVTGTPSVNGIYLITGNTSGALKYSTSCTGSYGVTSATVTILPLEAVSVCSGSGAACADNATTGVTTSVIFTGIKHTERAFDGIFVSGPVNYTDLNPTCPSAGITMTNCVHLAGGANTPNAVAISNLLGGPTNSIEDDSYSPARLITSVIVPKYSTSFGCPVDTSILAHSGQLTSTPSGSSEVALLTLSPPASCQVPAGACLDIDVGFQHTTGTMPTDYAIVLSDSAGATHVASWLMAQQSVAVALYTFTARFCNNPNSQSTNSEWITALINGISYFTISAPPSGKGMFGTSGLVTTSPPLALNLWIAPSTTGSACTYTTSSATPFSSCPTSFSGTDVYKAQFGRIVLVEQQ